MKCSIGIVGLPNVGKSTLFKALTKKQVDASNYPFCTIDPNIGIVPVPDDRLTKLAALYNSESVVPNIIEFVDIAGLVKGAHKGEGLGNQFLSRIREVDAICQVIRDFTDPNVTHVSGRVNPEEDKATINTELAYADLATMEKRLAEVAPKARSGDKTAKAKLAVYEKVIAVLDKGQVLSQAGLTKEDLEQINDLCLLTVKPMLYVLNVDEKEAAKSAAGYVPICAKIEAELAEMPDQERQEYLASLGLFKTGLDRLVIEAYRLLGLITFFTAGPKESRAWTVEQGSTAPVAGSRIHTDFEQKFIKAEIANWQEIIECGGEAGARAKGKMRIEGRDYIVQDGDVVFFHI